MDSQKQKEEGFEAEGVVVESVKGAFRVEIEMPDKDGQPKKTGQIVLSHLAGKLRKNFIKIVPGDRVKVEISPYDMTRGRITYRMK